MENIVRDRKRQRRINQNTMKKRQQPDDNIVFNDDRQILQLQHSSIHADAVASSSHHSDSTVHPSASASASSRHPSSTIFTQTASSTSFPHTTTTQSFSFVPFANNPSAAVVSTSTPIADPSRATIASPMSFGTIFGSIAGAIIVAVIVGLVYRSQRRNANSREGPAGTVRYRPPQNGGPRKVAEKPLDASYPYFKADASMPSSEGDSSYPFFRSPEPISAGSQVVSETSRGGGSGTYLEIEIDEHDESQYESSVQSSPKYPTAPEPSYPGIGERWKPAAGY